MLDEQNIAVDHLVKIIQALQIGRTTGTLVATRGDGASYELGTLVFFNGRVAQARVGRREGREAFNLLSTWGKCRYNFVPSVTSVPPSTTEKTTDSLSEDNFIQSMQTEVHALPSEQERVNETIPYRSKPLQYSLQVLSKKNLSRTHRNLFLLVDGSRRVVDLMRLLKLDENDVLALLYDLQDAGIITLPVHLSF